MTIREQFLEGMSRAACTVSIITTDGAAGKAGHRLGYALLATKLASNQTYDGKALVTRRLSDNVRPSKIVLARRDDLTPTRR